MLTLDLICYNHFARLRHSFLLFLVVTDLTPHDSCTFPIFHVFSGFHRQLCIRVFAQRHSMLVDHSLLSHTGYNNQEYRSLVHLIFVCSFTTLTVVGPIFPRHNYINLLLEESRRPGSSISKRLFCLFTGF